MDINVLRGIATLIVMLAFLGMVVWVYAYRSKSHFDEAANLPFDGEDLTPKENKHE